MTTPQDGVLEVLARELDLDQGEIGPTSTIEDVENWDSLGHLRVCMAMESRFGTQIPLERVGELTSVQALVDFFSES